MISSLDFHKKQMLTSELYTTNYA